MSVLNDRMAQYASMTDSYLEQVFAEAEPSVKQTADAMRYSSMIGGKRIRPVLTLEFCRICGGDPETALPFAAALEMIHTSSLIHDDLPCMDNDDFRRGKPSCHKQFGENYALLAGDALMAEAFLTASRAALVPERVSACLRSLAYRTGIHGMLGGQTLDEENETLPAMTAERLFETDLLKTGALIQCGCEMGCLAAGASAEQAAAAAEFGKALGLAFQITDDILDVTGNPELLGKATGSDAAAGKATYVTLLGLEGAQEQAAAYTQQALSALDAFEDTGFLREFTSMLLERDH